MKYLGVIVFAVLMSWTWNIIHSEAAVSFETHSGIQEKLSTLIEETIKAKRPTATDIRITRISTEPINETKVKAFFIYSFKEQTEGGPVETDIQGEGLLERQANDGSGLDRWSLTKVQTTSDTVSFEDGLVVTPDEAPAATAEDSQKETTEPATDPTATPKTETH